MKPKVSVLIPMRNAEPFIASTLSSILLEQDVAIEILVIDDKSTDGSLQRVRKIHDQRIKIIAGKGEGISSCLNIGLESISGEIVMRCDADDLYPEGRIRTQVEWLDAHPEYGAVCGGFSTMDAAGCPVARLDTGNAAEDITTELNGGKTRTSFCTFALRTDIFDLLGGFRPYFVTAEDIDFQLRLGEIARVMYLPESFYFYRIHDASVTHTQGSRKRIFYEDKAREFLLQRMTTGQDDLQRGCPPEPPDAATDKPGSSAKQIRGYLTAAAWQKHAQGDRFQALALGCRALKQSPWDADSWRSFFALMLKPPGMTR